MLRNGQNVAELRPAGAEHRRSRRGDGGTAGADAVHHDRTVATGDELLRVEDLEAHARAGRDPVVSDPAGISLDGPAPGRSSDWPACWALAGPSCSRPCTAWRRVATRSGRILLQGKVIRPSAPRQALALGIAFVPEDRRASRAGALPLDPREHGAVEPSGVRAAGGGRAADGAGRVGADGGSAAAEVRPAAGRGRHAVRRQPAEGRVRPDAADRAAAAAAGRADARCRRRRQGGDLPAAGTSWPARASACCSRPRSSPNWSASATGSSYCATGATSPSFSTADSGEGDLLAAAMGESTVFERRRLQWTESAGDGKPSPVSGDGPRRAPRPSPPQWRGPHRCVAESLVGGDALPVSERVRAGGGVRRGDHLLAPARRRDPVRQRGQPRATSSGRSPRSASSRSG